MRIGKKIERCAALLETYPKQLVGEITKKDGSAKILTEGAEWIMNDWMSWIININLKKQVNVYHLLLLTSP